MAAHLHHKATDFSIVTQRGSPLRQRVDHVNHTDPDRRERPQHVEKLDSGDGLGQQAALLVVATWHLRKRAAGGRYQRTFTRSPAQPSARWRPARRRQ